MNDFTDEQARFLTHDPRSRGRLVAGPGAGKSFTCVAYMATKSSDPASAQTRMRMLTFTRAATAEFAQKLGQRRLSDSVQPPSTIHAFALQILRKSQFPGVPQPVRIADEWETAQLIRPQLSRLLRSQGQTEATPSKVEALENDMAAGFESLSPTPLESAGNPALTRAYQGLWAQHRDRLGYTLRSELPYRASTAIDDLGVPDLSLDLLLVDEYQDLNKADIRLLHLVAESGIAVVAVGDEDQSIYGFRHAAPEGIRNFLTDFNADKDYRLSISRRCGAAILRAAQDLIQGAPGRPLQPRMEPYDRDKPGVLTYLRFQNDASEANAIAAIIKARLKANVAPSDIAVLVRSSVGAWQRSLVTAFDACGIPIASAAWADEALSHRNLRIVRALASLALDRADSLAWMTLLKLRNGIGDGTLDKIYLATRPGETVAATTQRALTEEITGLSSASLSRVRDLIRQVDEWLKTFAVPDIFPDEGWGQWMIDRAPEPLSDDGKKLLLLVSGKVTGDTTLGAFLAQLEPLGKDFALSEQAAVRFMTMTSSKGLTVNTTIVVGTENDLIPFPGADPDEERRLLYVAMTRATDCCVLTLCTRRQGPIARRGQANLGGRTRTPLLEGVLDPQDGPGWLAQHGHELEQSQ